MLQVHLPDGSTKEFASAKTPRAIAESISPRLAKAVLAAEVNDNIVSADDALPARGSVKLRLLTRKDPEALAVLRRSCAHLMARAIMRLRPGVQLVGGTADEEGFYFELELLQPLTERDFPAIEAEMKRLVMADEAFERIEIPRARALEILHSLGQGKQVELIENSPATPHVSFCRQGEFIDLCLGPHLPSPRAIGALKLLSLAPATGKEDSPSAQRLFGTAFFSQEDIDNHFAKSEAAQRRDHRVLGKQLQLFAFSNEIGPGLCLWLSKGALIRAQLAEFLQNEFRQRGYLPVYTPDVGRIQMYQASGFFPHQMEIQLPPLYCDPLLQSVQQLFALHFQGKLTDRQFIERVTEAANNGLDGLVPMSFGGFGKATTDADKMQVIKDWFNEQETYLLKPMTCLHHTQIYKAQKRSYKELPLRFFELGSVHRYEKAGQLHGLTRLRGFTQDESHIFCTAAQVPAELENCLAMSQFVLASLGLDNYRVRLAGYGPHSDKPAGSAQILTRAQDLLAAACTRLGIAYTEEQGDAPLAGPQADFIVTDCLGREWQLGTVQLDYSLPGRFGLEYTAADGKAHQPVMIHATPLGSLERLLGLLIEHFAGAFPLWLAPEQVRVITVSEKSAEYGRRIEQELRSRGLRVTGDFRPEKLGAKIRDGQLELIPYMLVVGSRDEQQGTVSVRDRLEGDLGDMSLEAVVKRFQDEIRERRVRNMISGSQFKV